MTIDYIGHSAFKISDGENQVLIDPWIEDNPSSLLDDISSFTDINYVLVTHEHDDHGLSDAIEICKRYGAKLVTPYDTAQKFKDISKVSINTGGTVKLSETLWVHCTLAFHATAQNQPCGFVVGMGEQTIYHAGDTALFSDMKLIGERFDINVAMLPIGDVFTMGPKDAAQAAEFLAADKLIPMHYDTFDILTGTPEELESHLTPEIELKVIRPGESIHV